MGAFGWLCRTSYSQPQVDLKVSTKGTDTRHLSQWTKKSIERWSAWNTPLEESLKKQKVVTLRQHSKREKSPRPPSLKQTVLVRLVTAHPEAVIVCSPKPDDATQEIPVQRNTAISLNSFEFIPRTEVSLNLLTKPSSEASKPLQIFQSLRSLRSQYLVL